MLKKITMVIPIIATSLFGAKGGQESPLSPENFTQPTIQESKQGKDLEDLRKNQFYLDMNTDDVKTLQKRDRELKDALYQFSQKEINYKPVIRPLASMDTIQLHPYFTHTILLPQGSVISYVDSSVEMAVLKFENNMLMLRPKSDFDIANLTIIYKLKDKNQVLNLLAERYSVEQGEKLNQVITYQDIVKRDPLEVINAYFRENGKLPDKNYNFIKIDGVDYRIVRDDKYGNITVQGKTYRVDNNIIFK